MAKNLIIVESPAKTRTLKKFLGREFDVAASLGHIRDLPKKDMGIGEDFEPVYEVISEKKDVVKKLKAAARKADAIYLAPDPDREGEAIAWHIAQILGKDPGVIRRVTFNEITRRAVLKALDSPGEIDTRKVEAQQARRILDRLMGFKLSPLLWDKVKRGLSAGRVQSVALKMVCGRQVEIDAFTPEEYWLLEARLEAEKPPPFVARLDRIGKRKAKVGDAEQAAEIEKHLRAASTAFVVAKVERKESRQRPAPPFITSRLQQEAARRFGFPVRKTMSVAQGLYEGREIGDRGAVGLITYMRTDSTRIAQEALIAARDYIGKTYGDGELPDKPNVYRSKKGAQDAHEAIRPTYLDLPPEAVRRHLKDDELKIYKLIWDRFIASQMKPAVFDVTQVDVAALVGAGETATAIAGVDADLERADYTLRVRGKTLKFPGFLRVYQELEEKQRDAMAEDAQLPELRAGQRLDLLELTKEQKFTQPPAQYSEATLVRALEESGIGRPSTYATIISTLYERDYVERIEGRFRPTQMGKLVNQLLQQGFNDIINEGYTASLEEQLDRIEEGKLPWRQTLTEFDSKFRRDLEIAARELPDYKRQGVPSGEKCPQCGKQLLLRVGRFGTFLGCTDYPECRYTRDPDQPDEEAEAGAEEEVPPCEECGKPMKLRRSRFGAFYGCSGFPECKNTRQLDGKRAEAIPTGVSCPECGEGEFVEKRSRRGKIFYSCNRYPKCKQALWNKPVDRPCPQCGAPFLVEKTTKKKGTRHLCQAEGCDFEEAVRSEEA